MDLNRLTTETEGKIVTLLHASDVVRFSFLVHNSISYLDLSISENFGNRCITSWYGKKIGDRILRHSIEFISTEEKCRKLFAPNRNILYTLHLDLSKRRESSLKEPSDAYMASEIPHIAKLDISHGFYIDTLSEIIKDGLQVTVEKLRLLRLILKIPKLKHRIFIARKLNIVDSFISCFYPDNIHSELFECFIKNFNMTDFIFHNESAEILEFLLYHMRDFGRDLEEEIFTIPELTYLFIFDGYFSNIGPILKYIDTPGVSLDEYDSYIHEIPSLSRFKVNEIIAKSEKLMNRERTYLILMALWIFEKRNEEPHRHEDASEALRLLWNCSTQAYMTFKDVERAFGESHSHEVLADVYKFYCLSIGEDPSCIETRPLTHFCRATIRKVLYQNKIYIPKGVRFLPLPKSLQSFLNLEKQVIPRLQ